MFLYIYNKILLNILYIQITYKNLKKNVVGLWVNSGKFKYIAQIMQHVVLFR